MLKHEPVAETRPAAEPERPRDRRKPGGRPQPPAGASSAAAPESTMAPFDAPASRAVQTPAESAGQEPGAEQRAPQPEDVEPDPSIYMRPDDDTRAAFQRLGGEGLARLRARYAEVMARIAERPMEEPEREELKSRAERLNPDGWVTDADVAAGLEQYEAVYDSLRAVVGQPRRRRRRR